MYLFFATFWPCSSKFIHNNVIFEASKLAEDLTIWQETKLTEKTGLERSALPAVRQAISQ
jgi:hypothetical protein